MYERKPVPGYQGLEADNDGVVWLDGIERPTTMNHGYVIVRAEGRPVKRSRLVCLAFHGERPSPEHGVLHWNDIRIDDRPANLRWGTQAENAADARRNGSRPQPRPRKPIHERGPGAKLSAAQVSEICRRYAEESVSQTALASEYGICQQQVSRILNRDNTRKEASE